MHTPEQQQPPQNTNEYIEQQKERHDLPIHKSGIELLASTSLILAGARLVNQENLNYNPEVFDEYHFKKQREYLETHSINEQRVFLEQFSVKLSKEYRENLKLTTDSFLSDFKAYFPKNTFSDSKQDLGYQFFQEFCLDLLKPEVEIQNVYELYVDLTEFLISMGVEKTTLAKITTFIEKNNLIKHTTH